MIDLHAAIEQVRSADRELASRAPAPFHLPVHGLEAVVAGSVTALGRGDWWVPGLRERVGGVLRDVPLDRLVDGFDGAKPYKIAPPTASPALRALLAVGIATAAESCVLVHLGIGSVADGAFTEALNLAKLTSARVIFVVAVDPLGEGAPIGPQSAARPAALARAYGLPAIEVDGRSADAVHAAVTQLKSTGGLVEASL